MAFLGSIGIAIAKSILEKEGAEGLANLLLQIKPEETRNTFILAAYPVVDVELEKLASATKTKVDDIVVAGIKEALEMAAEKIPLTLPNLDND